MINVTTATTAELLTFFNANTGGAPVKKFADRKTAERRCQALADEMFEEDKVMVAANPDYQAWVAAHAIEGLTEEDEQIAAELEEFDHSPTAMNIDAHSSGHQFDMPTLEGACPSCGATADITSGRIVERAGKQHLVDEGYFMCHSCGHEWGTKDNHYVRPNGAPIIQRPAMSASLKLDRQILSVNSGIVYKNACQVWKSGLVSSSQCDRLSAVLYGAAKAGNRLMSVTINGHIFTLAVK